MNFSAKLLLFFSQLWSSVRPQVTVGKHQTDGGFQGYVAEWEYKGASVPLNFVSKDKQSPRANPATWLDSSGTWWLFGGGRRAEANSSQFLGDLWFFHDNKWTILFQPIHDTFGTPMSSYPENLSEPTLCGSLSSGHLAVFGKSMTSDPELFEDNTVWLFDAVTTGVNSTNAVWTSYICCDACLPDKNTSLEFCPHFSQSQSDLRPLVWCSTEGLMTLSVRNDSVDWWQFDLVATEWVKLSSPSPLGSHNLNLTSLFNPRCKTVSDSTFSYIVCAVSPVLREMYVLSAENSTVEYVSTIKLNNAFTEDPQLWSSASVLTATKVKGYTIIALAYQRLLDFWIHDHSTNRIISLENLWQGESLKEFQHSTGFYHVTLTFLNETTQMYIINPRKSLIFDPNTDQGNKFLVRIEPDTNIFLPDRDPLPDSIESTPIFEDSAVKANITLDKAGTDLPKQRIVQTITVPLLGEITVASQPESNLAEQERSTDPRITKASQSNLSVDERAPKDNDLSSIRPISTFDKEKITIAEQRAQFNKSWTELRQESNLTQFSIHRED